jgi:hypothetical protein
VNVARTPTRLCIVGDESSHKGHHYLVYGTIGFNASRQSKIEARLRASIPETLTFERKWNHKGFLGLYLKFVDQIFACCNDLGLSFRCTVIDAHQANSPEYRSDEPETSLERYIYHHLRGYARRTLAPDTTRFVVTLDQSPLRRSAEVQAITLNHTFRRDSGKDFDIFESVVDGASKENLMIQAADVLTGAVAWVWNERYASKDASEHKRSLASHIAKRARLPATGIAAKAGAKRGDLLTLGTPTLPHHESNGFAIWKMDFSKSKHRSHGGR